VSAQIMPLQRDLGDGEPATAAGDGVSPPASADGRGTGDIGELCERFLGVCESAVDPLEISSALEFDGLNDSAVRERYGLPDVFALAEEMHRRVPRRPSEPEPQPDPWQSSISRPVLHGLLYGVPTVFFPAATGLLAGPGVTTVLIVALLTSWCLGQSLAYVGYFRLGRADRAQAARLLRFWMAAAMVAAILPLLLATLAASADTPALIFGAGLVAYMLGSTVLMVLGAEQLLLIVLAPGIGGATTFLLLGRPAQLDHLTWGALAATPVLALLIAAASTVREAGLPRISRRARAGTHPRPGSRLRRAEALGALPSAAFGLLAAGLLVFPVAVSLAVHGRTDHGALLASLPLSLSMGAAEWTLVWFRRRTQRLLRTCRESRTFARRSRLSLLAALLAYLSAAALLTAVVCAVAAASHLVRLQLADLPQIVAYLTLGGGMFVALLLQAFGARVFPVAACAVALAFEVACRGAMPAQVLTCLGLVVVLTAYAALVLANAIGHAM
jgi:hypothetical protein